MRTAIRPQPTQPLLAFSPLLARKIFAHLFLLQVVIHGSVRKQSTLLRWGPEGTSEDRMS